MAAMRSGAGDRRQKQAERRLFEIHARLAAARAELEVVEAQHAALEAMADDARVKMLLSETALAHREFEEARRHEEAMRRSCAAARAAVSELERVQSELFDNLVV